MRVLVLRLKNYSIKKFLKLYGLYFLSSFFVISRYNLKMVLPSTLHYIAPVIGLVTTLIGIAAVLKPEPMSKKFGIAARGSALPYVVSTGIRDVFIGLSILTLVYFEQWLALGFINLFVGIVAISDFLVVIRNGDKKTSVVHLAGALIVITYGVWLLEII